MIILIFVFSKLGNVYKYVVRIISISFPWSKLPWALVAIVICFADMYLDNFQGVIEAACLEVRGIEQV